MSGSWLDGVSDSLSEFAHSAVDLGGGLYKDINESKQAAATTVANENATRTENARIQLEREKLEAVKASGAKKQEFAMYAGGAFLVLCFLFLVFRK